MDAKLAEALFGVAMGGIFAAVGLLETLAERGLVTPDEIDMFAHRLILPLEELPKNQHAQDFRAMLQRHLEPELAKLHQRVRNRPTPPA